MDIDRRLAQEIVHRDEIEERNRIRAREDTVRGGEERRLPIGGVGGHSPEDPAARLANPGVVAIPDSIGGLGLLTPDDQLADGESR
jgi:hypothetical protein